MGLGAYYRTDTSKACTPNHTQASTTYSSTQLPSIKINITFKIFYKFAQLRRRTSQAFSIFFEGSCLDRFMQRRRSQTQTATKTLEYLGDTKDRPHGDVRVNVGYIEVTSVRVWTTSKITITNMTMTTQVCVSVVVYVVLVNLVGRCLLYNNYDL